MSDSVSAGSMRKAIDLARLPWIRPLVNTYARDYASVSTLFAGNPAEPAAWRDTIRRVQASRSNPSLIAGIVADQLERRQAPAAAHAAARDLANPQAIAVVTGQQAGAFGGPLYTVLKALTAVRLARTLHHDHGVPVVPVFWVDAEDHDWDEVKASHVLDKDLALASVTLPEPAGAGALPVGSLVLDARVETSLTELAGTLAPTEFTSDVLSRLSSRYRAEKSVATACAGWLDDLLGHLGLVVFEANDARAKPLVSTIFESELQDPGATSRLVREAGAVMQRLGHEPQIEPSEDAINLFYLGVDGRRAIKHRNGRFVVGDTERTASELGAEVGAHPEHFSPNVVLRPIVQDRLFPTVCYVAGPSELAYQAQLGEVYRRFQVEAPLLQTRASVTLIDSACARFFDRHDVAFESLQSQDDSLLNQLLERQLPPEIERSLEEIEREVSSRALALRDVVAGIDPTLSGVVDTTTERVRDTLKTLQNKIVQASKKKDETLRRQFTRARSLTFPGGHPQERVLNIVFFANRFGPAFADRLLDVLPEDGSAHYLITF